MSNPNSTLQNKQTSVPSTTNIATNGLHLSQKTSYRRKNTMPSTIKKVWDSAKKILAGLTLISGVAVTGYLFSEKLNTFATIEDTEQMISKKDLLPLEQKIETLQKTIDSNKDSTDKKIVKIEDTVNNIYLFLLNNKKIK